MPERRMTRPTVIHRWMQRVDLSYTRCDVNGDVFRIDRQSCFILPARRWACFTPLPDFTIMSRLVGLQGPPQFGNRRRSAARAGTTGCWRASDRAFDWQPKDRLESRVWCRAPRRRAPATRFQQ